MMANMINPKSISYTQIKSDIDTYLRSLSNFEQIQSNLTSSNLEIITDLLAGFGSYLTYKNNQLRNETYLSTARLPSSIYSIAKTFGYIIKRFTAPSIKIKYLGIPTVSIKNGDIIGNYDGKYDIIYFGNPRKIEKLDEIDFYLGHYLSDEYSADFPNGILSIRLSPSKLKSIDDNCLEIEYKNTPLDISKDIEDYVINSKIIDYSQDPYSTELMIADKNYRYGASSIANNSILKINYIETDGMINEIDINKLSIDKNFIYVSINHLGSSGQDLLQIKKLVPLYYSTQRRMVTLKDHVYITEAHQFIKSAYVERDDGTNQISNIKLDPNIRPGDLIDFSINKNTYKWELESYDLKSALKEVANKIRYDPVVVVESINTDELVITTKDAKFLDDWVIRSGNIYRSIKQQGIEPRCCTVNIFYVKYNTIDDPIPLSYYEQRILADYLQRYKMVGTRIILIPASRINSKLNIDVRLTNPKFKSEVELEIRKLVNDYELILDTNFIYKNLLADIAQITALDPETNDIINPVISAYPNRKSFKDDNMDIELLDIPHDPTKYIKFSEVIINFI